jgi:PKD repeat protein
MRANYAGSLRLVAGLVCVLLVAACGGKSKFSAMLSPGAGAVDAIRAVNPPPASAATMQQLTAELNAQLAALGKSVSDAGRHAPSAGCEVDDLTPTLLDADGNGALPPYGVSLRWTERLLGDYDENGEVDLADLTKLGQYFNYKVKYDAPELHNGIADIPSGDPEDFGDVAAGSPPASTSGAFNWRLAAVDGNRDGVIDIHDVTALAKHWHEAVTGYIAYRKGPQDSDFVMLTSGNDPAAQVTVRRFDLLAQLDPKTASFVPIRYATPDFFILDQPAVGSTYSYKVVPFCSDVPAAGPESPVTTVQPFDSQPSNDGVLPILTETLLDANGNPVPGDPQDISAQAPFTVRFDASGSHVPAGKTVNYLWDFDGDGVFEFSSGTNPVQDHTYTDNGRFSPAVRLLVLDDASQKTSSSAGRRASSFSNGQTAQTHISVISPTGNVPPLAKLTASKTLGTVPLTVVFDASGSTDSDGTIKFYEWDFNDDGQADFTSSTPTATYTFGLPGLLTVRVKVIDDKGGYDTATLPVITSNADGNWPPSASLVVNPSFGAAPLNVHLSGKDSLDPDGQIVKYEWDLNGDFTFDVDSGAQPELDYTFPTSGVYNVWLRVTDPGGLTSLARTTVVVNTPPFGGLEASPLSGPGPLSVTFDASTSLDLDGTIVKYEWDFDGDGVYDQNTGTVPHVTKTLYKIGKQHVVVRLTDNLGATATATVEINVLTPKNNLTPLASLAVAPNSGNKPLTVTLTATGSDPDPDGKVDHYDWDFDGDGIVDDQTDVLNAAVQHTYNDYGLYHATVWVVDNAGSETPATADVKVWDGTNQPPTAAFTVNPSGGPPNTPLSFSAASSSDPEGPLAMYEWDFDGDGTFDVSGPAATARDVQRTYAIKGTYNVILRVTDAGGSHSIFAKKVVVGNVPVVKMVADRAYAELPNATFNFDASRSQGVDGAITNYEWDMNGDGVYELSTGVSPFASMTFQLSDLANYPGGIVHPRLRVTNEIGAVTEVTQVQMPALDASGQPLRDSSGNLVLDPDGGVKLMPVDLHLRDNYDEVEDNDTWQTANLLMGPGSGGKFGPTAGGDTIQALQPSVDNGTPVSLTRSDPALGNYVEASLGQRNLSEFYDGDDDDWYAFRLSDGAHVQIDQQFDPPSATGTNFILRLYDQDGTRTLAQAQTTGSESIAYDFRDPGLYYIRVNRFVGEGQNYKLFLKTTPLTYTPEGPAPDNNNTTATANSLHLNGVSGPLIAQAWGRINKTGGDGVDWYKFSYSSPVTVHIFCGFSHALGDIDIFLYDQNLNLLGYSNTADDNEEIWRTLPNPGGTQTAYIKVSAYSGSGSNYTLSVGYPPGAPTALTAQDGSANGKIHVAWSAPVGGNPPNGYDLYVSDSQFGYYTKLAGNLITTSYDHDLSAAANIPLQNSTFWYKVKATITGQADSDFSNADSGFVNGIKPAVGLTADDALSLDHVNVYFYSSPFDPALGTNNFGIEPTTYRLYADPGIDGNGLDRPKTLIASFDAGAGEDTLIPALGGLPARTGKIYRMTFDGSPAWSATSLRGLNIVFTVDAEAPGHTTSSSAGENGSIAGLAAPTSFDASQNLFSNKVRISWTQPTSNAGIYPDGYIIQYAGEFDGSGFGGMTDLAWTDLTAQPIPYVDGQYNYTYYDLGSGAGDPPARKYRLRAVKTGISGSPFTPTRFGYCQDNTMQTPSYGDWYVDSSKNVQAYLNQAPVDSVQPLYWTAFFWRHDVPGGWRGWQSFNRESTSRSLQVAELSYLSNDTRKVYFVVAWRDPTVYGAGSPPAIADGDNGEGGSGPTTGGLSYSNGWNYSTREVDKTQSY